MHSAIATAGRTLRRLGGKPDCRCHTCGVCCVHAPRATRVTHVTTPGAWDFGEIAGSCKSSSLLVDSGERTVTFVLTPRRDVKC
jgi:hypothetical protein